MFFKYKSSFGAINFQNYNEIYFALHICSCYKCWLYLVVCTIYIYTLFRFIYYLGENAHVCSCFELCFGFVLYQEIKIFLEMLKKGQCNSDSENLFLSSEVFRIRKLRD